MKKIITRLLPLVLVCLVTAAGCSKVKDIKINSCGLESFTPKGLRAAKAVLALEIDNPAFAFGIQNLDGVIKYKGEDFIFFKSDGVDVARKSVRVYDLPCEASLAEGVSITRLLSVLSGGTEGLTADINAKVLLKKGVGKTLKFKDLNIQELMKESKAGKEPEQKKI